MKGKTLKASAPGRDHSNLPLPGLWERDFRVFPGRMEKGNGFQKEEWREKENKVVLEHRKYT